MFLGFFQSRWFSGESDDCGDSGDSGDSGGSCEKVTTFDRNFLRHEFAKLWVFVLCHRWLSDCCAL